MFKINKSKFGFGYKPMIIAEISANHNGSLKIALKMVDAVISG